MDAVINGHRVSPGGPPAVVLEEQNARRRHLGALAVADPLVLRDCTAEQIQAMLSAATCATRNRIWEKVAVHDRLQALLDALTELQTDDAILQLSLLDSLETGVAYDVERDIYQGSVVHGFPALLRKAAAHLIDENATELNGVHGRIRLTLRPRSPVAIIAPWNAPVPTIGPKLLVALLCGCCVIVKSSEHAPSSIGMFVTTLSRHLPAGVVQLATGGAHVGSQLLASPSIGAVQFTGAASTASKISVAGASALRPLLAECGGSNCAILLDGANVKSAARHVAMGVLMLNGQWCMGISRLLLPRRGHIAEQFLDELRRFMKTSVCFVNAGVSHVRTGEATQAPPLFLLGPLAFAGHAAYLRGRISCLGGRVEEMAIRDLSPDHPLCDPCVMLPTLIHGVDPLHPAATHELFGPIALVHLYDDVSHAVEWANLATGQLACYVFGPNAGLGEASLVSSRIDTGMVMWNGVTFSFELVDNDEPLVEFVGTAGVGRDGNASALISFFTSRQLSGCVAAE